MFSSLLVANRAEIACRIFRTARAMGMRCIGVHSEVDAKAKHVREADESVLIGPAPAAESYLRADRIIEAAKCAGAEAIHPGYGFLSENPDFAQAVIDAGLIWVGPSPASIRAMGLKDEAKRIAEEADVPVVPGYRGEAQDARTLAKAAKEIGLPVLIKAVAGGGGRGIREVRAASEFSEALASAKREAEAAFGDDRVLIEKLIERPRHIEVQVFGDKHGNLVHMFERDCSLQRRRQKVIEEAPAPGMTDEVRAAMTEAALKVARAVAYENAGTVEFIVDGSGPPRADGFWFLEMNTRLQVEHPVTEAVTGLDLVEWQFRVAAGERLPKRQEEIALHGHAIEARICAEDPSEGFQPSVGRLVRFRPGFGPRFDAGFDEGDVVSPYYDSLLAKLIVRENKYLEKNRDVARLMCAVELGNIQAAGVRTNIAFLLKCLSDEAFGEGAVHTGLVGEHIEEFTKRGAYRSEAAILFALAELGGSHRDPWDVRDGWRNASNARLLWSWEDEFGDIDVSLRADIGGWIATVCGRERQVALGSKSKSGWIAAAIDHQTYDGRLGADSLDAFLTLNGENYRFKLSGASREHASVGGDSVKAPLPGKVVAVTTKPGAQVKKGDPLLTLEAMKMEHALKAPRDGVIAEVAVKAGAQVKEGALLVRLEEEAE